MRAVRLHDVFDLRFEQVDPVPAPAQRHVRVRVAFAGICGSDIHNYKTGQWISRKPSTAGHEFSGIVDAVGEGVTRVSVGDKMVADSRDYCGTCTNCKSSRPHLCVNLGFVGESMDGGFADYVDLPEQLVFRAKPDARLDILALAEPLAVALHALAMMRLTEEPLLVIGCGPIGALAALASRLTSRRCLLVCDQNEVRCRLIAQVAKADALKWNAFEARATEGEDPVRFVLDTTGHTGIIGTVVKHISGGTLGLVGIGTGSIDFDPVHAVEHEIRIVGCHAFADEMPQAISLLSEFPEQFEQLIRHRISLDTVPDEFDRIVDGQAKGIKTLIAINPSDLEKGTK